MLILNGVNLGTLGWREPSVYGAKTLAQLNRQLSAFGKKLHLNVTCRQTDDEARFCNWIRSPGAEALVVNPGAWTHTSVAVRDAIASINIPVIEVHISNIFSRETFRNHSFIAPLARGVIVGLGTRGYVLALEAISGILQRQ